MCRRNKLTGCCLICFGLGILIGEWITASFICIIIGFAAVVLGMGVLRQK